MMNRKNPITINEGFRCEKCGTDNSAAPKTCRNHCRNCLHSLHVDQEVPGDRLSECRKLMEPHAINKDGKKGFQILHVCLGCSKKIWNKVADDDRVEALTKLMQQQNNQLYG